VDNGRKDDSVGLTLRPAERLLRLPENLGPAGGYAAGLAWFLEVGTEWAWVMDDDCSPAPNALAAQLAEADGRERVVLGTMIDRDTGVIANTQGWCGVLIPRSVVASIGVPNADLFWWTEDTEYLQWRIPRAGYEVVRSKVARVVVSRARKDLSKPAWKYYYEARNQVYYRLTTQGAARDRPLPRHLTIRVRAWRATRSVAKLGTRALLREREQRAHKLGMVVCGTFDGLRGRLGRRVPVDEAHRPDASRERPT
jgi:GT2 family glycosyltransferase